MKKLNLLCTCILALCLLIIGVAPVYADEGNQDPPLILEDMNKEELETLDKLDLMPEEAAGRKVHIEGGFKGIWVTDSNATDNCPGNVAGIYGTVKNEDGTSYGFFSGLWRNETGKMGGYLKGKYRDGEFRGIWRCLETGVWGPVKGRYSPAPDATAADMHHVFFGKWATWDGQLRGHLKGRWAPLAAVKLEGKFNGQWMYANQLTAASIQPDGKLAGTYSVAVFKDGTRIHLFRGTWTSRESDRGKLGGLIVDGRFYGLWNSGNGHPRGYLKGVWKDHRFKGVWAQFDHNIEGRLWGVYRPMITPTTVDKQPLPGQQTILSPLTK